MRVHASSSWSAAKASGLASRKTVSLRAWHKLQPLTTTVWPMRQLDKSIASYKSNFHKTLAA